MNTKDQNAKQTTPGKGIGQSGCDGPKIYFQIDPPGSGTPYIRHRIPGADENHQPEFLPMVSGAPYDVGGIQIKVPENKTLVVVECPELVSVNWAMGYINLHHLDGTTVKLSVTEKIPAPLSMDDFPQPAPAANFGMSWTSARLFKFFRWVDSLPLPESDDKADNGSGPNG